MENSYNRQNEKFITFHVNEREVIIRYNFETLPECNSIKITINLIDLANLLVVLGRQSLAQIELELEMEIMEGEKTKIVPLPIPERLMHATPMQLIQLGLESSVIKQSSSQ